MSSAHAAMVGPDGVPPDMAVEEVRARVARLSARLDDVERYLPPPGTLPPDVAQSSATPAAGGVDLSDDALRYADLTDWVTGYFAHVYPRPLGGQWRWCPRWSEHPEASERLHALWRTWQVAVTHEPLGLAAWLREHLDHHLPVLMSASGPFASCSPTRHEPHRGLPTEMHEAP